MCSGGGGGLLTFFADDHFLCVIAMDFGILGFHGIHEIFFIFSILFSKRSISWICKNENFSSEFEDIWLLWFGQY